MYGKCQNGSGILRLSIAVRIIQCETHVDVLDGLCPCVHAYAIRTGGSRKPR